jgi:hypothetical protein
MPIEIRELHIKAVIDGSADKSSIKPAADGQAPSQPAVGEGENMEAVINACVEKVLEILKEKMER